MPLCVSVSAVLTADTVDSGRILDIRLFYSNFWIFLLSIFHTWVIINFKVISKHGQEAEVVKKCR